MKVTVLESRLGAEREAAVRIVDEITAKPSALVGLSTGRTTGGIHREMVSICREDGVDVSKVKIFGVDEVSGVSTSYFGSCWAMLHSEVIAPLGIPLENFLMLPTESKDWEKDCKAFNEKLSRLGGVDILILGIGENGHLGFNQPGSSFSSITRESVMYPELEERIRRETASPADKHLGGVTLGLKEIMEVRKIVLVATGKNKASIIKAALRGPRTEDVPASILQTHPNCECILDSDAASLLER